MADVSTLYGQIFKSMASKLINWGTGSGGDVIKAMLVDSTYVPDKDAHQFAVSVTGEIRTTATTLSAAAAAAATTVSVAVSIPVGNYVQVGTTDNIRQVTAVTGAGPFTLTLSTGLTTAAASGAAVQANPGYTAGGITLTNKTINYDTALDTTWLDADDLTWSGAYIPAAHTLVVYDSSGGSAAANPLICWTTFTTDKTTSGGSIVVMFDVGGVVRITAGPTAV